MAEHGPTAAKWMLGERLAAARIHAGMDVMDAADALGSSESTVRRIEAGQHTVSKGNLKLLVQAYGLDDAAAHALDDMRKRGSRRGWWAGLTSTAPRSLTPLFGMEAEAAMISVYEPEVIPGLLQTYDYARAIAERVTPYRRFADLESAAGQRAELQMTRQREVSAGAVRWFIVGEQVLMRRHIGHHGVVKDQLEQLVKVAREGGGVTVQIVPIDVEPHAGWFGPFTVFQFDDNVRSPLVYVESHGGNLYIEQEEQVRHLTDTFDQIRAAAYNPAQSIERIQTQIEEL